VLEKVREKCHLTITSKVIMATTMIRKGIYIRFREAAHTEGEPTDDGLLIVPEILKTVSPR